MIEVVVVRNIFEPRNANRTLVEWRDGIRAGDLVPSGIALIGDDIWIHSGTRRLGRDDAVADGDRVYLITTPKADWVVYVYYAVVLIAAYFLAQSLVPKPPKLRDDDSSATFGFSGIRSNRTEGEPIPAYYGRTRQGGQVVAEFVESRGSLGSFYNVLLSMGEGPIYKLAGMTTDTLIDRPLRAGDPFSPLPRGWIFVHDTDAADIPGTEVHVRLGSLEQQEIPGLSSETQTVTIDSLIRGPEADSTAPQPLFGGANTDPTLAADNLTSSNGLWTTYGTIYQTAQDADEFTIVAEFPAGLFLIDEQTGAVQATPTSIAVRYIELDGGGSSIATGGPEGDGYVRLRPTRSLSFQTQSRFALDHRFPFLDPQTYVRPTPSRCLSINPRQDPPWLGGLPSNFKVYAYGNTFGAALSGESGVYIADFSIEAWVQIRQSDITNNPGSVNSPATIANWMTTTGGNRGGFQLHLQTLNFTIAPGHSRARTVPVLRVVAPITGTITEFWEKKGELGDPTGVFTIENTGGEPGGYAAPGFWRHVVATYKNNADGTLDRVRIYVDRELVLEKYGVFDIGYPSGLGLHIGKNGAGNTSYFKGWIDELVIWKGELTQDDVDASYNGGQGRTTPPDAINFPASGIVRIVPISILHFDAVYLSQTGNTIGDRIIDSAAGTTFFLTTANDGLESGTGVAGPDIHFGQINGARTFIDQNAPTNVRKRGRYRIEVMRALADAVSQRLSDDTRWRSLLLHLDEKYTYPESPLLGIRVPATENISGGAPNVTALGYWRLLPEWDGASTFAPTFLRRWSSNPARVCLDAVLAPTFGLGNVFRPSDVDVLSFDAWADYCDEPVYDQRGSRLVYPDWSDMRFDSGLFGGGVGGIEVSMPAANLPAHLVVGDFLGWYGLPAITAGGGPYEDTNVDPTAGGGYEVGFIQPNVGGVAYVRVYWTGSLIPWTNGALLSTQVTGALTGTVEGRERRFEYDGAADVAANAWDFLIQVCASAHAVPIRDGRRLRVRVERPREVLDLVGMSQVVQGTFEAEYLSSKTRDNAIEIGFLDRNLNYERSTASTEHPTVQGTSALSDLRRKTYFLEGVVRRTQVLRHALFLLNAQYLIRRRGRFVGSVDLLGYEPGDLLRIAHDVIARGVGGRALDGCSTTSLKLDRTIVLESGKSYRVAIRRAALPEGEAPELVDVDETTTGLGTKIGYEGDAIALSTALIAAPAKDDAFLFYEIGSDLVVSIESISLTADLRREVSWIEYVPEVFDVEGAESLPDLGQQFALYGGPDDGGSAAPDAPSRVGVREILVRGPGGSFSPGLAIAWEPAPSSFGVAGWELYVGRAGGQLLLASTAPPAARSAEIVLSDVVPGELRTVSVVAVAASGARRSPGRGGVASVRVFCLSVAPAAPGALSASMVGDKAVYSLAAPDGLPAPHIAGGTLEVRRGGWILGQPVISAPDGVDRLGPTSDWTSAAGGIAATLQARRRDGRGSWSAAAEAAFDAQPASSEDLGDVPVERFVSVSLEGFGDGWTWDGATTPNSTLVGLVRNVDGDLEFDSGFLTATYTTAEPQAERDARPEDVFVSAFAEIDQIHPLTWDAMTWAWDDPGQQWTWEGPLNDVGDGEDAGRCSISIEVRVLLPDRSWTAYRRYRPTRLVCLAAQFRITITRPTEDFNVRLARFSTEILRAAPTRYDQDDLQSFLRGRVFRRA